MELSDELLLDLHETRNYYSEISSDLLKKMDTEIKETMEQLELDRQHFQKRYRNIKIVFTNTFPFGIHYLVHGNTISIPRVLHQKI